MIPSVACLRLSDVSVIYCVTYFQFPIQSWYSSIWVARHMQHCAVLVLIRITQYRTLDVAENLGMHLFTTERTAQLTQCHTIKIWMYMEWPCIMIMQFIILQCWMIDWVFTYHPTQNSSFQRRSSHPISWLSTEKLGCLFGVYWCFPHNSSHIAPLRKTIL